MLPCCSEVRGGGVDPKDTPAYATHVTNVPCTMYALIGSREEVASFGSHAACLSTLPRSGISKHRPVKVIRGSAGRNYYYMHKSYCFFMLLKFS